jgi:hypothetical protein
MSSSNLSLGANPSDFAAKLKGSADNVSRYLMGKLPDPTRRALGHWQPPAPVPKDLENHLLEVIKKVVQGPSIWDETRFQHLDLSPDVKELLARDRKPYEVPLLNRLLLQLAYPVQLRFFCNVFVSYARGADIEGPWSRTFFTQLFAKLAFHNPDPQVFFDEFTLKPGDLLEQTLLEFVRRSHVMVPILTKSYFTKEWCKKELNTFCKIYEREMLNRTNLNRIIAAERNPVDTMLEAVTPPGDAEPLEEIARQFIKRNIRVPFYEGTHELDVTGSDKEKCIPLIERIAKTISDTLQAISDGESTSPNISREKTVYLAHATKDVKLFRDYLRKELNHRNFTVFPEDALSCPIDAESDVSPPSGAQEELDQRSAARTNLRQCRLSVHIVGNRYGETTEEEDCSIPEIEYSEAAQIIVDGGQLDCVIWTPLSNEIAGTDQSERQKERQKNFLERLDATKGRIHELSRSPKDSFALDLVRRLEQYEKIKVYLALTTRDQRQEWWELQETLKRRGYDVLPLEPKVISASGDFPSEKEVIEQVEADLKRCQLSVHLIGCDYGFVPEGGERSVLHLQVDLAIERAKMGGFVPLLWIPERTIPAQNSQRQFLEYLNGTRRPITDKQICTADFKRLKCFVLEALQKLDKRRTRSEIGDEEAASREAKIVHLDYDLSEEDDAKSASEIRNVLAAQRYTVELPSPQPDERAAAREDHIALSNSDAALIYWGNSNPEWVRKKCEEFEMTTARRKRSAPRLAKAVIVCPSQHEAENREKDKFRFPEGWQVCRVQQGDWKQLPPFLAKLR